MENDWIICSEFVWEDIEKNIKNRTCSLILIKKEISKITGVMTRSKNKKLIELTRKLEDEQSWLDWYEKTRNDRIESTKAIINQLLDFGFGCPTIQFQPFEYNIDEFCTILEQLRPIAETAYDLRMRGFRCTLFY